MSLQSVDIFGFKAGVQQKNKKPFLLPEDAFQDLQNVYVWREEVKKREGIKLIGRLKRRFDDADLGNSGASVWSFNIYSTITPAVTPEDNAEIQPGSVTIYLNAGTTSGAITGYTNADDCEFTALANGLTTGDTVTVSGVVIEPDSGLDMANNEWANIEALPNSFKIGVYSKDWGTYASGGTWTKVNATITLYDQGNGLLATDPPSLTDFGYINYLTGDVVITHSVGAGLPCLIDFSYYPSLPVMGICNREIPALNNESTLWFDTKYCYIHDGADYQEFLAADAVTWDGSDSDFFWSTNYRGSEAQQRLFFETNFVRSSGSPMRYTDGSSWTTFQPIIGGEEQSEVLTKTLAAGSLNYMGTITDLPILEGTLVITVGINSGDEPDIILRDTPKDGTLVGTFGSSGTINYTTGDVSITFADPLAGTDDWTVTAVYDQEGTFLFTARILIPYYGRLLAFNTWEGVNINNSVNLFNRCRFSQIGSPIQQDAWRSDVFGKGGFIDAPTNEEIVSATFYKNTLIVFFERSTWRLQYLGEYGLPFIWERISSDFGSESTFSSVLFDNGVLTVGDKAIVGSSGGDVQRIDLDIPDQVYNFKNTFDGPLRVQGIRDFKKEVVYWCFPDNDYFQIPDTQYFPNKTLLFNYRNNTFAFFRNNVTAFGNFQYPGGITWDRLDIFWDDENVFWNDTEQALTPLIVSGNQQGFCHFYGYDDVVTGSNSTLTTIDQESLSVTNVTVGATVVLEVINHNLSNDEFIYLTGLNYVVTASKTAGSTTLNDQVYMVQVQDKDNIVLFLWDIPSQSGYSNFTVTNVGTYMGGGKIALFPRVYLETKDFSPFKQPLGQNLKTSYIDFLFDVSIPSPINVIMKMNTDINMQGNLISGNQNVDMANSKTGFVQNVEEDVITPGLYFVTSKNHCLLNGDKIAFQQIKGMTELNGNEYTVTFITVDEFSITDTPGFTPYVSGGYWTQTNQQYFTLSAKYSWHRFFATCYGQFLSVILTNNNDQMSQLSTHQQNFVLNAMKLFFRPGGKNIFGR